MADVVKHKFQSTKPDGLDATLVRPSNWNEEHSFSGGSDGNLLMRDSSQSDGASWVGGLTVSLTNRTGEQLVAGDVVALDPDNDSSVVYADTKGAMRSYVVALRTINDGAVGPFIKAGFAKALVTGTVTRGNWLHKSATNAALEDTGLAETEPPGAGVLAVALESATGPGEAVIDVFLLGVTYPKAGGQATFTSSGNFIVPAGVTEILATLVGGGGGGGAGGSAARFSSSGGGGGGGGGGGAGEVIFRRRVTVTPGETITVTVGAGGAGKTGAAAPGSTNTPGTAGSPGDAGGNTSISGSFGTITARGGLPGTGGQGGHDSVAGNGGNGGDGQNPGQNGAGGAENSGGTNGTHGSVGSRFGARVWTTDIPTQNTTRGSGGNPGGRGGDGAPGWQGLLIPTGGAAGNSSAGNGPGFPGGNASDATITDHGYGAGGPGGGGGGGTQNNDSVGAGGNSGAGTAGLVTLEW